MSVVYRRAHGSNTWHFREDCTHWPAVGFDEQSRTPGSGVCCLECTYWPPSGARLQAARSFILGARSPSTAGGWSAER